MEKARKLANGSDGYLLHDTIDDLGTTRRQLFNEAIHSSSMSRRKRSGVEALGSGSRWH